MSFKSKPQEDAISSHREGTFFTKRHDHRETKGQHQETKMRRHRGRFHPLSTSKARIDSR